MEYLTHIIFLNFREIRITNIPAKADVQISLVEVGLVPTADTGDVQLCFSNRPDTDIDVKRVAANLIN